MLSVGEAPRRARCVVVQGGFVRRTFCVRKTGDVLVLWCGRCGLVTAEEGHGDAVADGLGVGLRQREIVLLVVGGLDGVVEAE